jgi:hypothetical protein
MAHTTQRHGGDKGQGYQQPVGGLLRAFRSRKAELAQRFHSSFVRRPGKRCFNLGADCCLWGRASFG